MKMNLTKTILKSILVNQKEGSKITNKKSEHLNIWLNELKPYLNKLQKLGYIDGTWKTKQTQITIKKTINHNTIQQL